LVSTISPSDAPSSVASATEFDPAFDGRSLVFRVSGRAYACQVSAVREVVPLERITRLPGAPVTVLGLINVRGSIVTVVNAGAVLHPGDAGRPLRMVLIADVGERGVGLAVERVADVRALRPEEGYTELDVRDVAMRVVAISEDE
jgi:chemotaxis signal transduction protein